MNAFKIEEPLTVQTVEEWKRRLVAHASAAPELSIDLQAVPECDAFGLQLLWAARCAALAAGRRFSILRANDIFTRACLQAGFSREAFATEPVSP